MKYLFFSITAILIGGVSAGQDLPEIISEGNFSIGKTLTIHSDVLGEDRVLNVYLPQSYERDSSKHFPVIYLLDGSAHEDFIHIAGLVQFGSFSWIDMVPESIVVGIANVDRVRDFTYPSASERDQKEFPNAGHSKNFIHFMEKELQPVIENSFRTEGPNTLIGQSFGGLLATEVLFTKAHLFDHYIIVSPSLWWDDEKLLRRKYEPTAAPQSIFIAVGNEGEIMEKVARQLHLKLLADKHEGTELFFRFLEDKSHGDALHLAAYLAFEEIFKSGKK